MNPFKGRHFQRDIILWAVRWYCKYGISYRELQEMLAERGVNVDHSTIYRWVQRYAPEMEKRLRWYWRNPSDLCPWHMDETYVKGHCCKVSDEAAFCLIQRPYISKTLLT
ncbi:IS6 family transposase, partial [Salmonella enterica subsp. enterica serovar 1,4,[5],12:i:-]